MPQSSDRDGNDHRGATAVVESNTSRRKTMIQVEKKK